MGEGKRRAKEGGVTGRKENQKMKGRPVRKKGKTRKGISGRGKHKKGRAQKGGDQAIKVGGDILGGIKRKRKGTEGKERKRKKNIEMLRVRSSTRSKWRWMGESGRPQGRGGNLRESVHLIKNRSGKVCE